MYIKISLILIGLIVVSIVIDIIRIRSNKRVIEGNDKIIEAQQELKAKINDRNEILKKTREEVIKMKKHHKELKDNLSIDYDHLAEEVVKRINENNKDITLTIDGEVVGKVAEGVLGN